jgi:mRNA interferase MazF
MVPLTTQLRQAPFAHAVLIPAMEAGQEHDSVAVCHQIRALDHRRLIRRIGELTPERQSEIEVTVMFVSRLNAE